MFWMMMYLMVFRGGLATDPSLFPDSSILRKAVKEPSRQELLLDAHAGIDAARNKLREDAKKDYYALRALSRNRDATEEEWQARFDQMDRERSQADTAVLDSLFHMRASMTRKEWDRVFNPPWYQRLLR